MHAKRGRPRNVETQHAILAAAYGLLLETGLGSVTVEKIAERAGVSKATIYKWWPNKAAVIMDGYLYAASERLPVPDTGNAYEDIRRHVGHLIQFLLSPEGRMITEIVGEGQLDPALAEAYRTRYFRPRRAEASQLFERGIGRGELRGDLDIGLCIDLIYGPLFYRLLLTGDTLNDTYAQEVLSLVWPGIRAE